MGKTPRLCSHVKTVVHELHYLDAKIPSKAVLQQRIRDEEVAAFANDPAGEQGKKVNVR